MNILTASGVKICPKSTDLQSYNKCVLKQLEALNPHLPSGLPGLKLPALDPLILPSLSIDRHLENLKIRANMSDIRVFGASTYRIDDLRANPIDLTVFIKARLPHIYVKGNYDVNGRLLLLPLSGVGKFNGNFSKYTIFFPISKNLFLKMLISDIFNLYR